MDRLTKVMDKYLSEAKLNWAQKELLQKCKMQLSTIKGW